MLRIDPNTGEVYDDGMPDEGTPPAPTTGAPSYTGGGTGPGVNLPGGDQDAARREYIKEQFKELLARDYSDAELDEAMRQYYGAGGDIAREYIVSLRGEGAGGFVWPSSGGGFSDQYNAGTYTPERFTEPFNAPTVEDMLKDPGYRLRMDETQRGSERMAAAKGSILSGGFVGRTLPRVLGEAASQEYGNTFKRAYDTYQQRYGQFSDAQDRNANAFAMNETGKLNQYQTRYTSYRDLVRDRQLDEDARWQREMDLARLGFPQPIGG